MQNRSNFPITITVNPEAQQTFRSYGFYVSHGGAFYRQLKQETKDKMAKYLFEDLKCKVVNCNFIIMPGWGNHQDRVSLDVDNVEALDHAIQVAFVDELGIGSGCPFDYAEQYGCEWAITICGMDQNWIGHVESRKDYLNANAATIEGIAGGTNFNWMVTQGGDMLKYECIPDYIHRCAELVKRMCLHWKFPIKSVACYDEPNFGMISPDQKCMIDLGLRKELDAAGLQHVKIRTGEIAGVNFSYTEEMMENKEAWEAVDYVCVHGFGCGDVDRAHADKAIATGKEVWLNSTGVDLGITVKELPRDENGVVYSDRYDSAIANVGAFLCSINLYMSYYGLWLGLDAAKSPDHGVWWKLFMYDPDESILGTDLVLAKDFDYLKCVMKAIEPGAVMRYCESSEEGDMTERYQVVNKVKNMMAAAAGVNEDGTWGIVLFNKTDTDVRRMQRKRIDDDHKSYMMVLPDMYLDVDLDVKGLEGTGKKTFQVYKTDKAGNVCAEAGTIDLIDGKGTITLNPLDLVALREIQ